MKHILLAMSILVLSACGGSGNGTDASIDDSSTGTDSFTLQNVRFDGVDYYEGEQVTVIEDTRFEVQWVSPTSASYKIDLYLSTNGERYSDNNKIVELKCGSDSFSLCPNATAEVQCEISNNSLSCFIGDDSLGNEPFQSEDLSSLGFIIKGCDALSNCDVKTFNLSVQQNTDE
ncbi:hypothetical protein KO495_17155 [Colwellia sp. D2M02]|uniref:hypothetical protein n=1 Tax=Colwellia sp. D2M02 TaxID=2841562 RepID=UPI001C09BD9C|nr:hypothetical protein [Colwellia sp. D2M02]MBU2895033.1 hypothetical protein [Colwellia sp. D2M02]